MPETRTEIDAAGEFVSANARGELLHLSPNEDGNSPAVVVLPSAKTIKSLKPFYDEFRAFPERKKGKAETTTLKSFIDLTIRHKGEFSVIFARIGTAPGLTAVIDYHESEARWCEHRVAYTFPLSPEWQRWVNKQNAAMNQGEFAAFLEDGIIEIMDPQGLAEASTTAAIIAKAQLSPASVLDILSLSKNLTIHVAEEVTSAVNLGTGEVQVVYKTEHKASGGGAIKVPTAFLINIPVFEAGASYVLLARLRYQVKDGKITWSYTLHRPDLALRHAVEEAATEAAAATGLPVYAGSPEV